MHGESLLSELRRNGSNVVLSAMKLEKPDCSAGGGLSTAPSKSIEGRIFIVGDLRTDAGEAPTRIQKA